MGVAGRLDVFGPVKAERKQVEAAQEMFPGAEEKGAHRKVHLVDESGLEVLAEVFTPPPSLTS